MVPVLRTVSLTAALFGSPLFAQSATITETDGTFTFNMNGTDVIISRTGPTCPNSCIQPISVIDGVATLGELEVISFLQNTVGRGVGLLVDVRMPSRFSAGTIPGAVNVPVATFSVDNPYRKDLLSALGATDVEATPNFDAAFSLVLFAGGPDDKIAPDAIRNLIDAGYPAGKIQYYRGGTADWSTLGLNLSVRQ
jgi:rhodanese-related sulfurtransferase